LGICLSDLTPWPPSLRGKGENLAGERSACEWDPKLWLTLSLRGWAAWVEGAQPPPRGFGGCAPKNLKRGGE
jgi:hypothetical protein